MTRDRATGVRSPAEAKDFSSSLCVQTSSEPHPASYPVGTGSPFPEGTARQRRDADHSSPFRAEAKNAGQISQDWKENVVFKNNKNFSLKYHENANARV
jgi:hypothetical protein